NMVRNVELSVERILNPPAPKPVPRTAAEVPTPTPTVVPKPAPTATNASDVVSNVIEVKNFLKLPLDGLPGSGISNVRIVAHHLLENKLLLDIEYSGRFHQFDPKNNLDMLGPSLVSAIAILDPATKHWEVVLGLAADVGKENRRYHRSTLLGGEL